MATAMRSESGRILDPKAYESCDAPRFQTGESRTILTTLERVIADPSSVEALKAIFGPLSDRGSIREECTMARGWWVRAAPVSDVAEEILFRSEEEARRFADAVRSQKVEAHRRPVPR